MANGTPQQLLVRFRGICAHLDLKNGNGHSKNGMKSGAQKKSVAAAPPKKRKRTVLLRHRNGNSNIEHHVPYIEFYADDVESISPDLVLLRYSRPNTDGTFARVDLPDGTEIKIRGLDPGDVEEEINYQRDVTHFADILKNVSKDFQKIASGLLKPNAGDIDDIRVGAVFDMPEGRLVAGEPEAMITRFAAEVGFEPRRLARWTDLYVVIPESEKQVVVQLVPLSKEPSAKPQEIRFKKTLRMITIGNEPERLILGLIGSAVQDQASTHGVNHAAAHDSNAAPTQPTGHFVLYYELLENPPAMPPLPIPTQLTGSGCPNHNAP